MIIDQHTCEMLRESFRIKSRGSPSDTQRILRPSFTSLVALNASAIFSLLCVFIETVISAFSKEIEPRLLKAPTSLPLAKGTSNHGTQFNQKSTSFIRKRVKKFDLLHVILSNSKKAIICKVVL